MIPKTEKGAELLINLGKGGTFTPDYLSGLGKDDFAKFYNVFGLR